VIAALGTRDVEQSRDAAPPAPGAGVFRATPALRRGRVSVRRGRGGAARGGGGRGREARATVRRACVCCVCACVRACVRACCAWCGGVQWHAPLLAWRQASADARQHSHGRASRYAPLAAATGSPARCRTVTRRPAPPAARRALASAAPTARLRVKACAGPLLTRRPGALRARPIPRPPSSLSQVATS
jgi:hypothetical protein